MPLPITFLPEFRPGSCASAAPRQIDVEVTAAIRKAALLGRISSSEVTSTLEAWLELTQVLHLVENRRLLRPALRESLRWGVSLFDALYVSLPP